MELVDLDLKTTAVRKDFHVTLLRTPIVYFSSNIKFSTLAPPLALAYLSASLRKAGFSVSNIDAVGEGSEHTDKTDCNPALEYNGLSTREIIDRIPENTDLLGVSCMFSSEWTHAKSIIKAIKKEKPGLSIVVGGEHASAVPELVLSQCPQIDVVALGEGEELIVDLAECFRIKGDLKKINGLAFKVGNDIIRTSPRARIKNVDAIPWPAWDLLPLETYLNSRAARGTLNVRTIPMLASRGCPYECTFCSNPEMYGRYYATRNPEDLLDEIQLYMDKYQIEDVDFFDLTAITKRKWIIEFCDLIVARKMKFIWRITGGTRTEAIDEEVIVKAKQAGCEYLGFAPETGSEEVIQAIKKKVDLTRMYNLFKIANRHGLATRANFIVGFPRETRFQVFETLFMQLKLAIIGTLDAAVFNFVPYPGCEETDYLIKKGVIQLDDNYFDSLSTNFSLLEKKGYCENVGPKELHFYRLFGMSMFYFIYYLIRPSKLFSFIKNFFGDEIFNSIFEQRVLENFVHFKKKVFKTF